MTRDFELMPCGPGAVLPAQVSEGVRWDADTSGERALMFAVLEDAVRCIENGRWQRRFRARRLAAEGGLVRCDHRLALLVPQRLRGARDRRGRHAPPAVLVSDHEGRR
jgi:hypothetical protein